MINFDGLLSLDYVPKTPLWIFSSKRVAGRDNILVLSYTDAKDATITYCVHKKTMRSQLNSNLIILKSHYYFEK